VSEELPLYTVSEISGAVRRTLEAGYGRVRVRGEISNWRPASSGHCYFVLKDDRAQLRAVLFRGDAFGLRFAPADGLLVEAQGEITVYEARGDLQLIVRRMAPSGAGALLQALEALKQRLAAEGLFDPAGKRPLPAYPRVIGVVTSPTGAAVRDILKVLGRRWPVAEVVFHPVPVQGPGAALEIARALERMSRWGGADVILVGRGGGSLEDLWAFNEEPVVRAIAACRTPVISAVGHETDLTLSDLAADVRAPTPSAAAEMAVPDAREVSRRFAALEGALTRRVQEATAGRRVALERIIRAYGFRRPERFLERSAERLDEEARGLEEAFSERLEMEGGRVDDLARRLAGRHPGRAMELGRERVRSALGMLEASARAGARGRQERLEGKRRALRALDPTGVLGRGYAIVRAGTSGRPVAAASDLGAGDPVVVQFLEDRFRGRVERVEGGGPWSPMGEENGSDEPEGQAPR
jgi:exodeoxyribonuclease VII large subunit